jgi:hypothetical protein
MLALACFPGVSADAGTIPFAECNSVCPTTPLGGVSDCFFLPPQEDGGAPLIMCQAASCLC